MPESVVSKTWPSAPRQLLASPAVTWLAAQLAGFARPRGTFRQDLVSRHKHQAKTAPALPCTLTARQSVEPLDEDSEKRFIERLRARDERSFNELVLLYEQRVYRLLLRMVGNPSEAQDLAQEVFVQVFKSVDTFRGDSKLNTWIYRISINLCKNRLKYLARRHASTQEELEVAAEASTLAAATGVTSGEVAQPDLALMGTQAERIVKQCIMALDEEHREILILRDVEDLPYEEIMAITGLAVGTVKSRIHRARTALKEKVARALGEDL